MEIAADRTTAANTQYNVDGPFGRRRHPIITPECGGSTQRNTHKTREAADPTGLTHSTLCPTEFCPHVELAACLADDTDVSQEYWLLCDMSLMIMGLVESHKNIRASG